MTKKRIVDLRLFNNFNSTLTHNVMKIAKYNVMDDIEDWDEEFDWDAEEEEDDGLFDI